MELGSKSYTEAPFVVAFAMSTKQRLQALIKRKDELESEIAALQSAIPSNAGSMVDRDGFPRSDIDIYSIRTAQHQVAVLQTDHKGVMREIEQLMVQYHSEIRPLVEANRSKEVETVVEEKRPSFFLVDEVYQGSPADTAGLLVGDEIVQFGDVLKCGDAREEARRVMETVQGNVGSEVRVRVIRGGKRVDLKLYPGEWSGRGLLGCHITPIN